MGAGEAESGAYSTVAPVHPHANSERGEEYPAVPIVTVAVGESTQDLHALVSSYLLTNRPGVPFSRGKGHT